MFSGGLDSTTLLHIAREAGFDVHAMSFNYGQRHVAELQRAQQIAPQMARLATKAGVLVQPPSECGECGAQGKGAQGVPATGLASLPDGTLAP